MVSSSAAPVAFLFPGQGSQYAGMGRAWAGRGDLTALFDEAGAVLGYDLRALCCDGPAEQLNQTAYTQPAMLVTSLAAWRALGGAMRPAAVAGHSVGEYAAVVAAGGLPFADAVALVQTRAAYMAEAVPAGSGLVAAVLGLAAEAVDDVCRAAQGVVTAANYNAPGQVVISGEKAAVERAMALAKAAGCRRVIPLPVSVPVHSSLMQPAADRLAPHLRAAPLADLSVPLVANADARPVVRAEDVRQSLLRQLPASVLWEQSMRALWNMGIRTFLELGPGTVLAGLAKRIVPEAEVWNVHDPASVENILTNARRCG